MKLSQFFRQLSDINDDLDVWSLNLAQPKTVESEGDYVIVAHLKKIEVDLAAGQVRFIPGYRDDELNFPGPSIPAVALESLPKRASADTDLTLLAQLPLIEVPREKKERTLVEIEALHVGMESQEAWLLVRPLDQYPASELPT